MHPGHDRETNSSSSNLARDSPSASALPHNSFGKEPDSLRREGPTSAESDWRLGG
jgi:hypothetical protein